MKFNLSALFEKEGIRSKEICGNALTVFASGDSIQSFDFDDNEYDDDYDGEISYNDCSSLANFLGV